MRFPCRCSWYLPPNCSALSLELNFRLQLFPVFGCNLPKKDWPTVLPNIFYIFQHLKTTPSNSVDPFAAIPIGVMLFPLSLL